MYLLINLYLQIKAFKAYQTLPVISDFFKIEKYYR